MIMYDSYHSCIILYDNYIKHKRSHIYMNTTIVNSMQD